MHSNRLAALKSVRSPGPGYSTLHIKLVIIADYSTGRLCNSNLKTVMWVRINNGTGMMMMK
jgi:hypothetical protein